ncbi:MULTISPECIES: CGNR zinc finger domain-containing protein [Pimelobacter]|uniref:CGNR zinc finger domain-containing protein n=1 Tax=Pimelobacter TaxID=2044 RepID=UPI001C051C3B|nr:MULTISPECIES: CGNR zinc finger domain-containing protein [Pimelobacter]MBU2696750.1 RNA-binding protein [Pimelobacter sp. 30-1]UUW87461.1 CGNR zinc finger domain-containing protein [Pimelobacter simplex]UUW96966.1 CGNR zinc finger domain-containing protein [Pimelobacter simplex]
MVFAHDTSLALQAAVALVNSRLEPVSLTTPDELEAFFSDHGYTGRHDGDEAELAAVHAVVPRLRTLLTADRDDAVDTVNAMLREASALPQLRRHDGYDWHLHAVDPERPLAERITVETAMAMIDVIRADEMSRLAICADDGCEGIVLDLSRNRSKRFCSVACGNRNAVAAYRARQANDG